MMINPIVGYDRILAEVARQRGYDKLYHRVARLGANEKKNLHKYLANRLPDGEVLPSIKKLFADFNGRIKSCVRVYFDGESAFSEEISFDGVLPSDPDRYSELKRLANFIFVRYIVPSVADLRDKRELARFGTGPRKIKFVWIKRNIWNDRVVGTSMKNGKLLKDYDIDDFNDAIAVMRQEYGGSWEEEIEPEVR